MPPPAVSSPTTKSKERDGAEDEVEVDFMTFRAAIVCAATQDFASTVPRPQISVFEFLME